MSGARFVVVLGGGAARRTGGSVGADLLPPTVGEWFSWLLIGGNNRELGRGLVPYATEADCIAALDSTGWHQLAPVLFATSGSIWWRWRLEGASGPVAGGGRLYHRRRECSYALKVFHDAVTGARLPVGPPRRVMLPWTAWEGGTAPGAARTARQLRAFRPAALAAAGQAL